MATISFDVSDYLYELTTQELLTELTRRTGRSLVACGFTYSKADLIAAIDAGDGTHINIVIDNLDLST
ncbi:hypothetical protein [Acidocella sp.]|uniref:hypothetical protein n=1 Tax=Acidocella sp. TaxID=50710 RepID=UPI0026124B04|nr:hypothetical protein [Acidocella sp.]MDD2794390.1 hypothetical protein [Acidocella sp.]